MVVASQCLSHIQWIACGVGKHVRFLEAHDIATALVLSKCRVLSFFHALSGCDMVYFFHGKGKKTAWATWKNLDAATVAFCSLGSTPQKIEPHFELIEQFIVLLYDHTTSHTFVNQARKDLFAQKGRTIELIPPNQAALIQADVKRATYQAGYCWAQSCIAAPEMPSPSVWGSNDTGKGDVFGHIYPKQLGLVERIASIWMQYRMLRAM